MTDPRPRFLIIGAGGFVGEHLARRAEGRCSVFGGDVRVFSADDVEIDITRARSVRAAFDRVQPRVVALLAALSDIDHCERDAQLAQAINVDGPELVARECARVGARLIYTSSAAVFDGARHGYREEDPPAPVSVYGRTKAEAEGRLLALLPGDAVILRIALVLGHGLRPGTNALLDKLTASFQAGKSVVVPAYEFRNPIDVGTLSEFILDLAARPGARGIFHLGATDSLSRFDLVCRLAERMGYPASLVSPRREPIPGRAPRGLDHFLLCDKIAKFSSRPLPGCDEVIERSLHATA